jgi:hypothetical protein
MSVQASFFKESHTSLGVFYPIHYIVAVFDTLAAAHRAEKNLRNAGFRDEDLFVATGPEFIEFEKRETGVAGAIMQGISRFFKTEQLSTDHNLALAERYAAFIFVHCPHEKSKNKAWDIIHEELPLVAHYYERFSVDQLAGEFSTD